MTICIGPPIIKLLAEHGSWVSEGGESVVAASDLFGKNPYAEIERLTAANEELIRGMTEMAQRYTAAMDKALK
jgi:hypothetical protein